MRKFVYHAILVAAVAMLATAGALAQTARLQVIHNSSDPSVDTVDVYVGETLLIDDFAFRKATPFMDVPAGVVLEVGAALANSTSSADILFTIPVGPLTADMSYVLVATGVLDPDSFAANPDGISTAFQLVAFEGKESNTSGLPGFVELAFVHGATDAPAVDAVSGDGTPVVVDLKYAEARAYQALPAGEYVIEIRPTGTEDAVAVLGANLTTLADSAAVVLASGFLDPAANADGAAFGVMVALPGGTTFMLQPPPVDVEVTFNADMSVEIATGNFDPATQLVVVAGDLNGWSTTADTLQPDFINPEIYTKTIAIDNVQIPHTVSYKFVTGPNDGSANPSGWEGGNDRKVTFTGSEPDTDGNGRIEASVTRTYNDRSLDDFFSQDVTITFQVDLRPAYYFFADSLYLPADVQTGENVTTWDGSVFANGPLTGSPNGWETWGPENLGSLTEYQLHDDGTNGDAVAGDTVYTIVVAYEKFDARKGDLKFGTSGYDNESSFAGNHTLSLPTDAPEATVNLIFGAMETAEGGYLDDLYDAYIALTYGGPDVVIPVVVRSGGEVGDTNVGVEEIDLSVPEAFELGNNYPNPFNPTTTFEYTVPATEHIRINVYDVSGRLVQTLVDQVQTPATYRATFDAAGLSSGIYLYQLRAGSSVITKKMLLIK